MEVKAKARYIRQSPRKVRLVANLISGLKLEEAFWQLKFVNKKASQPIKKLIDSAIANATHNFNLEKDNLYIKEIRVDQGPTLKRWAPKAYGRATPIRKRSSHISLILAELVASKKKAKKEKLEKPVILEQKPKEATIDQPTPNEEKISEQEAQIKEGKEILDTRRLGKRREQQHIDKIRQKGKGGVLKRIFRRKAV